MADTVRTRHRISGQIDENTPRHVAEHKVLGKHLDIVSDEAKPYVPELYKAKTESAEAPEVKLPVVTPEATSVTDSKKNGKD